MTTSNDTSILIEIALNPTTGKVAIRNVSAGNPQMVPAPPVLPKNVPNREALISLLAKNIATITFIKADGSKRVMKCTRNPDIIHPSMMPVALGQHRQDNQNVLAVFDLDINEWRSMTVSKIQSVEMVF
jgi:hypothetical protein